jgi:hypothetical protein
MRVARGFVVRRSRFSELRTPNVELGIAYFARVPLSPNDLYAHNATAVSGAGRLVHLVDLVHLVCFVHLVGLV